MKYLLKPIKTFKWFYLTQFYFTQLENVYKIVQCHYYGS